MKNYEKAMEEINEGYRKELKLCSTTHIFQDIRKVFAFQNWLMEAVNELEERFPKFRNPAPVVVALVPNESGGLLMVRRADSGLLALPGGFQNLGETWQEAIIREVREETGHDVSRPELMDIVTVDGVNLIFCKVQPIEIDLNLPHDTEVTELVVVKDTPWESEIAFPTHKAMIEEYFWRYE
jgi:8-oxo-dGTP pyrophosphatase MutT (NUDIX family)